jgi:hypothetical protein
MGQIMKRGQFFMISLIVISIVLLLSLSYANSANLMSVENQDYTSKLHFEIVKHAYDSAVPVDWNDAELLNRKKLLLCGDVGTPSIFNTSVTFTSGASDCTRDVYSPNATLYVSAAASTCEVFADLSIINTTLGYNCTTIDVYFNSSTANKSTSLIGSNGFDNVSSFGEYSIESIKASPDGQLKSLYIKHLISLNETAHSKEKYNATYRSDDITYTGSI